MKASQASRCACSELNSCSSPSSDATQDLCEGIGKGPWLGELDDVTVRHGVSLLHWRSGGVEHHHDTPPYPVMPSPTSGHSSGFPPIFGIAPPYILWPGRAK